LASSKMPNKREPTSSRPTLSSSIESTNYAEPSKSNKPAHIAPAHSPGTLQPHRQSCSGRASGPPTSYRPRQRFPGVPSFESDPTLDGTGPPRKSREYCRLRAASERIPADSVLTLAPGLDGFLCARPGDEHPLVPLELC
jgi:hypothetical protein